MLGAMTSGLAEAALSRRFFIGPLIALALVGVPHTAATVRGTLSSSAPAPSVQPQSMLAVEQKLLKAHDAEGVYHVDQMIYAAGVGSELRALESIDPSIRWGDEVIVEVPAKERAGSDVVILRAPIPGGGSLCMSEVSEVIDANTWYARVAGNAHCPPRRPGMRGWTTDQSLGWQT